MIRRWLARRRAARIDGYLTALSHASAQARSERQFFVDEVLPERLDAVAGELSRLLPEGLCFEWSDVSAGKDGDGQ